VIHNTRARAGLTAKNVEPRYQGYTAYWRHLLLADGAQLLDDALRADLAARPRAAAAADDRAAAQSLQKIHQLSTQKLHMETVAVL